MMCRGRVAHRSRLLGQVPRLRAERRRCGLVGRQLEVGLHRVGDWRRPWNPRPEAKRLAAGIPKAQLWAHDPGGLAQVGCVYSAQGFEFDYVGVVFGRDLRCGLLGQHSPLGHTRAHPEILAAVRALNDRPAGPGARPM